MNQQLIRPRIAAERLDCAISTIYRMFDRGELTRIQITKGSVGIPKREIDAIMNPDAEPEDNLEPA